MNYERGLEQLKKMIPAGDLETRQQFATLEARLRSLLDDEHAFGPSETQRHDCSRAVDALNRLALERLGASFVDLCLPAAAPPAPPRPSVASPPVSSHPATFVDQPWRGGVEVSVRGQNYLLHDPVEESQADDRSFIRRRAKAWQPEADRMVWLKQVSVRRATPSASQARTALSYEGRLLSRFEECQGFPRLLDMETGDDVVALVHTLAPGSTWAGAFGPLGTSLDAERALRLLHSTRSLCNMLAVLHKADLSHRHLTPDDVVLLQGRRDQAALYDLGLAARPRTFNEGATLYWAPEQTPGAWAVPGPHTDIFQLGAVLYHLLTGRSPKPFLGNVEPPSTWNPDLPPELDTALLRAIAEKPAERWPRIQELRAALTQAAERLRDRLRGEL